MFKKLVVWILKSVDIYVTLEEGTLCLTIKLLDNELLKNCIPIRILEIKNGSDWKASKRGELWDLEGKKEDSEEEEKEERDLENQE